MLKRLLITRQIDAEILAQAEARFDVTVGSSSLNNAQAHQALRDYDAILPTLGDAFDKVAFRGDTLRCKILGNFGVGYNHIDTDAAERAGVIVSNTPDVLTDATADIGMTLLLATARRAGEGERLVRSGKWGGFGPKGILGTHFTGKTLGIIGMGRIGRAVAKRGHFGFDMPVVFANRSPKELPFPATQLETMQDVMAQADFVVVTVPGGADTHHLINRDVLNAMKPSGIFINISRGEVVDEQALIECLEENKIAGAGLDVYEFEPDVPERLKALENCVLLPHLGSATVETRRAMGQMALDNIIAWDEGRDPPQRVTKRA